MKKSHATLLFAFSAAAVAVVLTRSLQAENRAPLQTVQSVNIDRYLGQWYEIARYPNRFQKKCAGDTTATYSARKDGRIQVVNTCRKHNGEFTTSRGKAKIVDTATNARLKVTFFWPFSGNYWIIGLDPEYRYAIVGEPSRKYLWILSRTPQMEPTLYNEAIKQIRRAGYDPERLIQTPQSGVAEPAA